jgi:fatty-acyl-CoA synthase
VNDTVSPNFVPDAAERAAMRSSRPLGHGAVRAYDWIAHHAAHRPKKEAIRDLASGRTFTYAELDKRANAMAAYFRSLGIGRGDRVAVLAPNGVEFFDIQFACARTGSIAVLLNWRLTVPELEYMLLDSSPSLLVHDASFRETATELQRRCNVAALLEVDAKRETNPYEAAIRSHHP